MTSEVILSDEEDISVVTGTMFETLVGQEKNYANVFLVGLKGFPMTDNDCDGDDWKNTLIEGKLYLFVKDKCENLSNDNEYDNCNDKGDNASTDILTTDLDSLMFLFSIRRSWSLQERSLFIVLSNNVHYESWPMKFVLVYLSQ